MNNEDTKVVIGGLYYPNTQLFNNNLIKNFVRSTKNNLCKEDNNIIVDNLQLSYDQNITNGI